MSDVEFVGRLTTLGVHWRFKETLQWSEPDLFTMPRGKGDSWQFGHRWGECCHFRLSLTFASSCIGSLKRWEVYPHNFKTLSFVLKQVEGSSYTNLHSDRPYWHSRRKCNPFLVTLATLSSQLCKPSVLKWGRSDTKTRGMRASFCSHPRLQNLHSLSNCHSPRLLLI